MKVLLIDTAFAAVPIYDYLVEEGHDVWVVGNRPADILARRAGERWIDLNYARTDEVEKRCQEIGIERVVPGCTDISILTALELSAMQGRADSSETYARLHFKDQFRGICQELGLPAPHSVDAASFPRNGQYICKPTDGFSGRGISVFDGSDGAAFKEAVALAEDVSPKNSCLIEPFVEGQLYSCTGFIENGRFAQRSYVIEGSSANAFAVDTSCVVRDFPEEDARLLEDALEKLSQHLQLVDGLLHTQFILGPDGPQIVEVSRRCPGDLYSLLIEYSTGVRYAARFASYFLGVKPPPSIEEPKHILRHTVTALHGGVYRGITFDPAASVMAYWPLLPVGAELLPKQGNRAGLLFCQFENSAQLERAYQSFLQRGAYRIVSV